MKKKLFGAIFALAVMVAAGYGVNKSMQHDADLSEVALSNVEALAWGEIDPINPDFKYIGLWLDCFNPDGTVIGKQYKCYATSQGPLDNCTDKPC